MILKKYTVYACTLLMLSAPMIYTSDDWRSGKQRSDEEEREQEYKPIDERKVLRRHMETPENPPQFQKQIEKDRIAAIVGTITVFVTGLGAWYWRSASKKEAAKKDQPSEQDKAGDSNSDGSYTTASGTKSSSSTADTSQDS